MFTPGQLVVYPAQGVGKIERIDSQQVCGVQTEFFIVNILTSNITLMVPIKSAANVGLRSLASPAEAEDAMAMLKDLSKPAPVVGQNWNRRQREYNERLKQGTLQAVAGIIKELVLISCAKELSFGEKRLLEQAMNFVSLELAHIWDCPPEEVVKRINELFSEVTSTRHDENSDEALEKKSVNGA